MSDGDQVKIILGGTFDVIHKGHRRLLERAFRSADHVMIGLTSETYAQSIRERKVTHYRERERNLEHYIEEVRDGKTYEIFPINDPYGPADEREDVEKIAVSEETREVAQEINEERRRRGLNPLELVVVETVKAEDGKRISATRVRRGEIDTEGNLLK